MKITIITATCNSASTLRDTFESILRQTFQDYEYIVVDGASKDGTVEFIKEYEPRFGGRMKWSSEPDKGIYDAMNKGLAHATGDVVGLLNSDDFYTSDDVLQAVVDGFGGEYVDALYAEGRNTVMGDEELEVMVRRANVDRYEHLLFHKSK